MQTTLNSKYSPLIFDHQRKAFDSMLRAAEVCFSPLRKELPIQPRTNSLIVGPSGVGKSHLAREVSATLGVPCKHLTIAEWMPLGSGSKGAQWTWPAIFEFLKKNRTAKGAVIILDEIDKLRGASEWFKSVLVETYRLLDRSVSPDLVDDDDNRHSRLIFEETEKFLRFNTLIIGAGAFQHIWDSGIKTVSGFGSKAQCERPSLNGLSSFLPRELVNRFRSDIVVLEELQPADYESILLSAAERMPKSFQDRFLALGEKRIPEVCKNKQGVRFLEELVGDVLDEISAELSSKQSESRWKLPPAQSVYSGR